jgi:hypothetical protein
MKRKSNHFDHHLNIVNESLLSQIDDQQIKDVCELMNGMVITQGIKVRVILPD